MLKLYIQGISIWLDVDELENVCDLEKSVAESAYFVLFYSKGFFNSINCRREVIYAQKAAKPITVMFELDDIAVDKIVEMKNEFNKYWPTDMTPDIFSDYIFAQDPIIQISNGRQFSMESIKLVAGRLLNCIPYYQNNPEFLDAGLKINSKIKPLEF